jgi:hypothetical protein
MTLLNMLTETKHPNVAATERCQSFIFRDIFNRSADRLLVCQLKVNKVHVSALAMMI